MNVWWAWPPVMAMQIVCILTEAMSVCVELDTLGMEATA